jgi:hypothetical protein
MAIPGIEQAKPFLDGIISQAKAGAGKPLSGNYLNIFRFLQIPDALIEQICQANGLTTQQLQEIGLDAPMSQEQVLRNMLSPYSCVGAPPRSLGRRLTAVICRTKGCLTAWLRALRATRPTGRSTPARRRTSSTPSVRALSAPHQPCA